MRNQLLKKIYGNEINDNIVLDLTSSACLSRNISKSDVRNELSDYIIIGTVSNIEGGSNYNSKQDIYTAITTFGQIDVLKVIKGDLSQEQIPFLRSGGVISVEEYEKGLSEAQLSKMNSTIGNLTLEEKKTKYVKQKFTDDIDIELGTTYLMYLTYNQDYDRYNVLFMEYGLNEVQLNDTENSNSMKKKNINNYSYSLDNLMVKDNVTGENISISDYIGDIYE